ncbi:26144_t:CDS:2 [Dentiscutata erythropus]|uniref:26144_t:CDS:1 n=1 Tax=Dentiscutata erythropus TaxID=1348616 RepID=A0A9N9EKG4_9GLOM|nr:26144_t:CDS:2 [Dentiscutata erythropus]
MSSIENCTSAQYKLENCTSAQYELKHATSTTEQLLVSITSSINNNEDLEIVCLLCSKDKRKIWLCKNNDSNTTNLWRHLERYHPDSKPKSGQELSEFTQLAFKKLLNKWILLNPNATISKGDTIRNDIIKSYEDESIVIKSLLQIIQDILKQFKAVKIRSLPQRHEQFMRQVRAAGLENCNLILDIKTR